MADKGSAYAWGFRGLFFDEGVPYELESNDDMDPIYRVIKKCVIN